MHNDLWGRALLLGDVAATLYMTGVIWTVQLVHYALFDRVGSDGWVRYHNSHTRLMTSVVLLPMVVELGTSGLLALSPPLGLPSGMLWAGAVLAALTWAVTFFVSVPLHGRLSGGFDAGIARSLLRTNWLRTGLWTAHAAVLLGLLARLIGS